MPGPQSSIESSGVVLEKFRCGYCSYSIIKSRSEFGVYVLSTVTVVSSCTCGVTLPSQTLPSALRWMGKELEVAVGYSANLRLLINYFFPVWW